jgi:hypothetical protein
MDGAATQWINASAGSNALLDTIMIALTQYGVPSLLLLVILQWWSTRDRPHVRHTCIMAGLSFFVGLSGLQSAHSAVRATGPPVRCRGSHLIISPGLRSNRHFTSRQIARGYHDAVREAEGKTLAADDVVIILLRGKGLDVSDTVMRKAVRRRVLDIRRRMRRRGATT